LARSPSRRRPLSRLTGKQAEAFRHQAEQCEPRSPLYAKLCRRSVNEPLVAEIAGGDERWDLPLRLLGGVHYLVLSGACPDAFSDWASFCAALAEHRDFLSTFVATQAVQTNEVQRSWMLLPGFLELARRTEAAELDLIELGPSAGLNLVWDRYRYRYEQGEWGPSGALLALAGDERGRPIPAALLEQMATVGERLGIDRSPLDVTSDEHPLLLKAFVWVGQQERLERLDRAIAALRRDPPRLLQGDFVELLPEALEQRRPDVLTVVFQTAALGYLTPEQRAQVRTALEVSGKDGRLAFLSTGRPEDRSDQYYGLWLQLWPDGHRQLLAHADFHGAWLEWRA
jgi:hypothetical protein